MGTTLSLFHTFPRARNSRHQLVAAKLILESILDAGLLLVPEVVDLPYMPQLRGLNQERLQIRQVRLCLTSLHRSQLPDHSTLFGPVSIEFDHLDLRCLGALPIYHLLSPPDGVPEASDLSFQLVADLYSIASRLAQCDPAKDADAARLLATVHGFASLFHPADSLPRLKEDGEPSEAMPTDLQNFLLSEWRIIGGVSYREGKVDSKLTEADIERLKQIDAEFFLGTGTAQNGRQLGIDDHPRADFCRMIRSIGKLPIRDAIRGIHIASPALEVLLPVITERKLLPLLRVF